MDIEQLQRREPLTGAANFLDRIVYAKREQKDAMVLYFAATHLVDGLNTIGRLLVTSPEHNSGKTTVLDAGVMMCQNGWMSDPTKWALQGKFKSPETRPTIFIDETSILFGLNGQRGRSNPIYKPAVEGYRKSATFSAQVDGAPQDYSAYCGAVLAGLKAAVPPDLRSRCIVIQMRPAPDSIELEDSLDEGVEADGRRIGEQMHAWAQMFVDEAGSWARSARRFHPKLNGRRLQVWGGMYAAARAAGPEWERRFMAAFTTLALDKSERPVLSAEEQILMDAGDYLRERMEPEHPDYLFSAELLRHVRTLDENIYKTKTDPQMGRLMSAGLGRAGVLTLPSRKTVRGWHTDAILALVAELEAMLEPEMQEEAVDEFDDFFDEVYECEFPVDDDPLTTTETTETTVPPGTLARRVA